MRFSRVILLSTVFTAALVLSGCEDEEDRDIFAAQKCLNGVGARVSPDLENYIDGCLSKINGYDNPEANVIKCSGHFIRGGLTNSKIIGAFELAKNAGAQKESTLINYLSLTSIGAANDAYTYCNKTNVPGLAYVASLSRIGTLVTQAYSCTDPMTCDIDAAIGNFTGIGSSSADKQAVGEMVLVLSNMHCQGENKNSNLCIEINSAKQFAGNDLELLAITLLNQF